MQRYHVPTIEWRRIRWKPALYATSVAIALSGGLTALAFARGWMDSDVASEAVGYFTGVLVGATFVGALLVQAMDPLRRRIVITLGVIGALAVAANTAKTIRFAPSPRIPLSKSESAPPRKDVGTQDTTLRHEALGFSMVLPGIGYEKISLDDATLEKMRSIPEAAMWRFESPSVTVVVSVLKTYRFTAGGLRSFHQGVINGAITSGRASNVRVEQEAIDDDGRSGRAQLVCADGVHIIMRVRAIERTGGAFMLEIQAVGMDIGLLNRLVDSLRVE